MTTLSTDDRRRAFGVWLRTGRLPAIRGEDGLELKFNPWHDPENGRFTFAGTGRMGVGMADTAGLVPRPSRPVPRNPTDRAARKPAPGTWGGGGFTGGGGGDFGGAGATGAGWDGPMRTYPPSPPAVSARSQSSAAKSGASARPAPAPGEPFRTIVRNGYTYQIDGRARTRDVSGTLTVATVPIRSRAAQRQAGGAERRAGDDGGHYIAARFNGPTEAFNHFAPDAHFNRGKYRLVKDEWARDKRAKCAVTVRIGPRFNGELRRPSALDVRWTVNGVNKSIKFPTNGRRRVVANSETEDLLNEIGQRLTMDIEYPTEPTLLYAELGDNWIGESIFKELGNQVLYRDPDDQRLPYALLELWEAQEGDNRWMEIEYLLRDGKFNARFIYSDEIDPEEDIVERRARSVRKYFGEKPIVYEPWSDDNAEDFRL
ncbi:DNA/RNA non-specific endonuclease [Sphingomonas sp. KR1UV-12]|uniref:DNA/RNA non-specific endonuclease n=1 Tax=Sphingomonas aurea TaxID=3063994 RepID=A0ABT9EL30_9SPHN|nr:DNA/RNA non-specific endonuclease [Sphingomonas sp. KR1UV-12]MDP1027677.1 DNA/RNA non-specific endonuclease [Sphingomonas sp. KR1UV-12]